MDVESESAVEDLPRGEVGIGFGRGGHAGSGSVEEGMQDEGIEKWYRDWRTRMRSGRGRN